MTSQLALVYLTPCFLLQFFLKKFVQPLLTLIYIFGDVNNCKVRNCSKLLQCIKFQAFHIYSIKYFQLQKIQLLPSAHSKHQISSNAHRKSL